MEKKSIAAVIFLIAIFVGLVVYSNSNKTEVKTVKTVSLVITENNHRISTDHFRYKEHDYIHFSGIGVVHDPDCKYCLDFFD